MAIPQARSRMDAHCAGPKDGPTATNKANRPYVSGCQGTTTRTPDSDKRPSDVEAGGHRTLQLGLKSRAPRRWAQQLQGAGDRRVLGCLPMLTTLDGAIL